MAAFDFDAGFESVWPKIYGFTHSMGKLTACSRFLKILNLVDEYIEGLLNGEAHKRPCDYGKADDLELKMQLPEWFDEQKYKQGQRFFWDMCFAFFVNMTLGLVSLFSVPSILNVLVGTRRSNSTYTAYKRYISTLMHVLAWYEDELKPGTRAWRSLLTVRTRHLQAGIAATLKGNGAVSQRDMALTQFGFIGFAILKPDNFSIRQIRSGDWEGFNHFWRTIGYMIGIEDRYNLCRKDFDETREACRILLERVFTPSLENVPEYFEHTAHVMLDGLSVVNSFIESTAVLFATRYMADVPGYVYTEVDRITFTNKLKEHLKGKSEDIGIDPADLMSKSALPDSPRRPQRLLYIQDYDLIETTPAYKQINFSGRYRLAIINILITIYNTDLGRWAINLMYRLIIFISFYFPYKAFLMLRFKNPFVNIFVEDPKDDTEPKPNSKYEKPPSDTWYNNLYALIW